MMVSRRTLLALAPALLLAAVPAAVRAQDAPSVPTVRSVYFDVGALARDRIRGGLEALAVGRFTVGLAGTYSHTIDQDGYLYPLGVREAFQNDAYCAYPESFSCIGPWSNVSRYRAWALDLSVRYYPSFLSFQNGPSRMMAYVGEFVGYHWRTWDEQVWYYGYGVDDVVPVMASRDTLIPPVDTLPWNPYPIAPGPNPIRHTLNAIQPGVEVGVRLVPFSRLLIDVGARFMLVTIDDPLERTPKGNVESRLVVAGGLVF